MWIIFLILSGYALDRKGIYYDPDSPSELEDILNNISVHPLNKQLSERACALRKMIVEKGAAKCNTGKKKKISLPSDKKIILVPGQAEDDASLHMGGYGLGNFELLKLVREQRQCAYIIYKPHPDVENKNRKGKISDKTILQYADCIMHDCSTEQLFSLVHEVHTLTSQTGFEALLRNIPVYTYGGAFYAGWGLTNDKREFSRRRAKLSLDELVAGVFLLYLSYYDWQTESFCRAEDIYYRLLESRDQGKERIWARTVTFFRKILHRFYHENTFNV